MTAAPQAVVVVEACAHSSGRPRVAHTGAHAWISAEDGVHVVGVVRERIMGAPVLGNRDRDSAEQVTRRTAARILDYPELGARGLVA